MILIDKDKQPVSDFKSLCEETRDYLNSLAKNNHKFKGGTSLEPEVFNAAQHVAKGSSFENCIQLISGLKFPDIRINGRYGIEVKSNNNGWRTTGGSVLESSRVEGIEDIFLMYGKLSTPVEFRTRPYEECLYDVAVTHSPRYLIDMDLKKGQDIFHKINKGYKEIRNSDNPIKPFLDYKLQQDPQAKPWWAGSDTSALEESSPFVLAFFNSLTKQEKNEMVAQALASFPELFTNNCDKFESLSFQWLNSKGIVCSNVRDLFTAGGKEDVIVDGNTFENMPQILARTYKFRKKIKKYIQPDVEGWIKTIVSKNNLVVEPDNLKVFLTEVFK